MRKKNPIPESKAKTAYGLLSEIAALAIAEPKRMQMGTYLVRRGPDDIGKEYDDYFPACGTVGCIAGWVVVLKNPLMDRSSGFSESAGAVLGVDIFQAGELFNNEALCSDSGQQTRRHARRVVSHIRRFQKKHRAQLLAKKV